MDLIKPIIVTSPISGEPMKPVLKTLYIDGRKVVEAHYFDPMSGTFVRKGTVSYEEKPAA